jgi:flagellar basal body-associated protein FliL
MKLTKKQKRIILISALSFILVLVVMIPTILILNNNQKTSSPTPQKNNLPKDITHTKTETITHLEQKLSADNIKVENLLQELKDKNYLKAGENN